MVPWARRLGCVLALDKCVQMWTRNYGALGQTARVCFGVGQVCPDVDKELWRLGPDGSGVFWRVMRKSDEGGKRKKKVGRGGRGDPGERTERSEEESERGIKGQRKSGEDGRKKKEGRRKERGSEEKDEKSPGERKKKVGRGGRGDPGERTDGSCQVIYSQFGLAIHQNDHQARRRFVEWAQNEIAVVPDFHKRILFSDEAHFWLNGYVNKQNCRIWREANPQVYVETPLHPEKLTVWCALWAGGIIGPYFFKNDEGHNVTVNGDRYRAMITNFFIPELKNHDVQELWFLQDGATCHTAHATIDLLKDTFGDLLISCFGSVNWPPISCDLTPLDYFLWCYVKSLVYADKPQTLDHLEDNIRRVIADIRPQMLEKVIENWTSRLDYIRASRGSYMLEIIFKM
ncbi:putative DD41D transposase [Trichonephila clavipes]|uniref:Putative DD41D transposase n=1 Tax=Trichonephila clavipes TaxID=2585209 RepID=A0A8X6V5U7_TRICX|nr:putative DD41D transposase [Trichonephila clavipes]